MNTIQLILYTLATLVGPPAVYLTVQYYKSVINDLNEKIERLQDVVRRYNTVEKPYKELEQPYTKETTRIYHW